MSEKQIEKNEVAVVEPVQPEEDTNKHAGNSIAGFSLAMMALMLFFSGGLLYIPFALSIVGIVQTAKGMKNKKQPYKAFNAIALPTSIVTLVFSAYGIMKPIVAFFITILVYVMILIIYAVIIVFAFALSGVLGAVASASSYVALLF